jgi:glutamate synthase domain-containing protein 1
MDFEKKPAVKQLAELEQHIVEVCSRSYWPDKVGKKITIQTRLKTDLGLDVHEFCDLLVEIFKQTGWVEKIIATYFYYDLSIEELSSQLLLTKRD